MKIDLILPPRKQPISLLEKPLISEDINIICKDPLITPFGSNVSTFLDMIIYMRYVKSNIGKETIKHMINEGLSYMLHFFPKYKYIVTCHGINIPYLDYFKLRTKLVYDYNLKGMKKANRIIAVSKEAKKDIMSYVKYPEDKIDVVYLGVDHNAFYKYNNDVKRQIKDDIRKRYNIGPEDKILLNIGSEQPRKNLPTLIHAFYKLKKKIPYVKLIKIGPEDWPGAHKELVRLISQLNLDKDIIFAGIFPNNELPKFHNSADMFVFPSYSEGFGIPPLESMACGCPVITTDKTSIPEIVGDAAIKLSDPFDVDLLARTMEEVLINDGLRENMSRNAILQASKFSWEKYSTETYKVYERVWDEE